MSEFTDLLLQSIDPLNAVLLLGVAYYVRDTRETLKRRINRLERQHMEADASVME